KSDIDLDRNAGTSDRGLGAYPHAAILDILADRLGFEPIDIEDHAIIIDRLSAYHTERSVDRFGSVLAVAEQVQIASRPKRRLHPSHKQHRSFENKSIAMLRPAQTIQESFQGIASQHDLEIGALVAGSLQQPGTHRGADVLRGLTCHRPPSLRHRVS